MRTEQDIATFMSGWLSDQLRKPVVPEARFAALGMDSIDFVRLADALAEYLGIEDLAVSTVLDHRTVGATAAHLATLSA